MSDKAKFLPPAISYDSKYLPVQYYNKSLEDLHESLREKKLVDKSKERELKKKRRKEFENSQGTVYRTAAKYWRNTFGQFGEEWVFLAFLGIFVAIISYTIDQGAGMCNKARGMLYGELADRQFAKWVAWVCIPVVLIMWDVGITSLIAPKAVGSGVPQIKTVLRGVYLKEFLSFRVLIAKWMGITATLGSGMPLGKEGPLIQMSSIIVTKMSKFVGSFKDIFNNENKKIELIGAAYAVGVACTFNAPIGGVLFSVEISTAYYAVRNYWRGFFAAVWGATVYRLLYVWIDGTDTIRVVFPTSFINDFPYDAWELIAFALLGLLCGFGGSLYIFFMRRFNQWAKSNKFLCWIKKENHGNIRKAKAKKRHCKVRHSPTQKVWGPNTWERLWSRVMMCWKPLPNLCRFVYPFCVVLIVSTVQWPPGIGQYFASNLTPRDQVVELFSNFTWTLPNHTTAQEAIVQHWKSDTTNIYGNLVIFIAYQFLASILASTMPIPCGTFIPNFRSGAALGRIVGEIMATWFPTGVRTKGRITHIVPGAYATVGAAAWSGAVTHTLSTSVIMFEMTSQMTHVIPVLISNLIANGVARLFTPSVYDLAIQAAKLPYLPDLLPSSSAIYQFYVEDFMVKDVTFIYLKMTYEDLKNVLAANKNLKVFPLVDNNHNMILLGSVSRKELIYLIEQQIGFDRRTEFIEKNVEDQKGNSDEAIRNRIFQKYTIDHTGVNYWKREGLRHQLTAVRICDLPKKEQRAWENEQLSKEADFSRIHVDPAPFQLVERTSLLKVHSLFSMMSIHTAYVTTIGKLGGVVGVKELRQAIEDANSGHLPNDGHMSEKKGEALPLIEKK